MASIFEYLDYRKYLKNAFEEKRKTNPQFSYRNISQKIGVKSMGFFSWVIQGKRNISKRLIIELIKILKFKKIEAEYFDTLVHFNQAKTSQEKAHYFEKLRAYRKSTPLKVIKPDQYEFFQQWYYSAIRELVNIDNFREDPSWIAKQLKPNIMPKEAKKALQILKELGFVKYNNKGKLVQSDPLIWGENAVSEDARTVSVRKFHKQMIGLAQEAIERFPAKKREISSLTVCVSDEALEAVKSRIVEVERELLDLIEKDKNKNSKIYQLNFQFFPLIDEDKNGKKNNKND